MKTILCLLLLTAAPFLSAQTAGEKEEEKRFTDTNNPHKAFWNASLPGGSYLVALSKIVSVSKHEYLLDGNLLITEVVIDTVGDSTVRIYQITPAALASNLQGAKQVVERGKDLLDRAGQRTGTDPNNMVHKTYPITTHSKIIEFRVDDIEVLNALHGSVQSAWVSGKGRRFVAR
jgi:hypothetical protein